VALVAGAVALVAGSALGRDAWLLEMLASPPALVRAAFVGAAVVAAIVLLREALLRLERSADGGRHDLPTMVRGIRFVFLAVAAVSAAAGWLMAHPLPIVVALVIAGIDVLETTFLLLVVSVRGRRG
jgi:protein-S-isoprenylcysteine O-methyltransferase Ste14